MIMRSDTAKYAKHVFLKAFNDVDVFVEDTAPESRKIYAELLRRCLGGEIRIDQVFPIGTKVSVVHRCSLTQGARPRRAVFIIDGDFDHLIGNPVPALKRLYRLKRYCIENYLIDEKALVSILDEDIHDRDVTDIQVLLDFQTWQVTISKDLLDFVYSSCVGYHCQCGLKTANVPLSEICSCVTGFVDPARVAAKLSQYEVAVDKKLGAGTYQSHLTKVMARAVGSTPEIVFRHLSGKSYLLQLLKRRLQTLFAYAPNGLSLKIRLAMRCDVSELLDVSAAME